MRNKQTIQVLFIGLLAMTLMACGGGSGGSDPAPVNRAPVAVAQALSTVSNTDVDITLSGTDADGDTLSYTISSDPANGALSGTAPNLTYTPESNFKGEDSFTFSVSDGSLNSGVATISINVTNSAPIANAQLVETLLDTEVLFTLTGTDGEGDELSFTTTSEPTSGTLSGIIPNLTYSPNSGFIGSDSFTFIVNDGTDDSAEATVSIAVAVLPNVAPEAQSQSLSTHAGTALSITLTGTDGDGDSLSYSIASSPTNGSLSGTAPNLTYSPNTGFSGADSFTFTVNDGTVDSTAATISIDVTNSAPIANAQLVETLLDTEVLFTLTGTDGEGDELSFTTTSEPTSGTLSGIIPNLTYSPNSGFIGSDSFTFIVNDGTDDSAEATVSITVAVLPNVAPEAQSQSLSTHAGTALSITLTGTDGDGDSLSYSIASSPTNGSLSGTAPNLTYSPNTGFSGADSFTFTVNDGTVDSTAATISIDVTNTAPVAAAQSLSTHVGTALSIILTGTDADGDSLSYSIVSPPVNGSLSGTAPNLTYSPNTGFSGADSFTFTVNDGTVDSTAATISIDVTNTAPVAAAQSLSTHVGTALSIILTGTDADGDSLSYSIVSPPVNGSLSGTAPNLTYSPNTGFLGADSFTFTVNDGTVGSIAATISIDVTNTTPVATAQSITTMLNTAVSITLAGTDADPEDTSLDFTVEDTPTNGVLTGTTPDLTYTPNSGFFGTDSFTFTVSDGTVDSTAATVDISVNNDIPAAFSFTDIPEIAPGSVTTSNSIVITGINIASTVSITGGEYSIDGGAFTTTDGTVLNNQSIVLRVTASSTALETVSAILTVGGVENTFSVTTSGDVTPPIAIIEFPSEKSLTPASFVIVRGITSDDGTVETVTVNGVDAISADNFINWTVEVPLQPGFNTLTVNAKDLGGNVNSNVSTIRVESRSILKNKEEIHYDNVLKRLLILDMSLKAIIEYVPATDSHNILSENGMPDNVNEFVDARHMDFDEISNIAYVVDQSAGREKIISVDLSSGSREIITQDTEVYAEHTLVRPVNLSVDLDNNHAYVVDSGRRAIIRFDLTTGNGFKLATTYYSPDSLAVDKANNRILLIDNQQKNIAAYNLITGVQSILSDNTTPDTVNSFGIPKAIVVDAINQRAIVIDIQNSQLMAVALTDGSRTILAENIIIPGNSFSAVGMVYDAANDKVYITTSTTVWEVDLVSGIQSILSDNTTPDSINSFGSTTSLDLESSKKRLLVTDTARASVFAVDVDTGERSIVSNSTIPNSDNPLGRPTGLRIIQNNKAVLVDPFIYSIMTVDLLDGTRTVLSDNTVVDVNNTFLQIASITQDLANNALYLVDTLRKTLLSVDVTTGDRTIVSDFNTPDNTNPMDFPKDMILQGGRGLVVDSEEEVIFSIDLITGARTVFSGANVPDNTTLFSRPLKMVVDNEYSRLLVIDKSNIIAVSLVDGSRTIFSGQFIPDTFNRFGTLVDITIDTVNSRAIVMDTLAFETIDRVLAVDLNTGIRSPFVGGTPSGQTTLGVPKNIVYNPLNDQVIVMSGINSNILGLLNIDLNTGNREVLSNTNIPEIGSSFPRFDAIEIDPGNNKLFAVDGSILFEVNLTTGERIIRSSSTIPDNVNPLSNARGISVDTEKKVVYVTDSSINSILEIDLTTFTRKVISSNVFPDSDLPFNNPDAVVLDKAHSRLLVLNQNNYEVLAVNITTGKRTIFTNGDFSPSEGPFSAPRDILLDSLNDRLLLLDASRRKIFKIDLETGERSIVAHTGTNLLVDLYTGELALTSVPNQVVITDKNNGVILMDLTTGEQVILSR